MGRDPDDRTPSHSFPLHLRCRRQVRWPGRVRGRWRVQGHVQLSPPHAHHPTRARDTGGAQGLPPQLVRGEGAGGWGLVAVAVGGGLLVCLTAPSSVKVSERRFGRSLGRGARAAFRSRRAGRLGSWVPPPPPLTCFLGPTLSPVLRWW